MKAPPDSIITAACDQAMRSPCIKSNRGAVVFDPATGKILGRGFNGQPRGFKCDGSAECRAACAKLCLHAEERAIRRSPLDVFAEHFVQTLELVHVKVVDGVVVPGGGPSCWQCSRLVVDAGLRGVWLYEAPFVIVTDVSNEWRSVRREEQAGAAAWRFYLATDFHRETLRHKRNRLPVIEALR